MRGVAATRRWGWRGPEQPDTHLTIARATVGRRGEREEERIALQADFDTAVSLEHRPQDASVPVQSVPVGVTEPIEQPRRPFDVQAPLQTAARPR